MRTAAVLRYSGGLSGRPLGVRLWEAGREVRADGISASVTVSGRAGVQAASNARCRRSPAEERFRRAVDSVFTSLRRVRKRDS